MGCKKRTVMVCRKREPHRKTRCDKIAARGFRSLKSDLFKTRGQRPAAQEEIMNRNAAVSPILRLPAEIRLRIYKFVLGGQPVWIGYEEDAYVYGIHDKHYGAGFFYSTDLNCPAKGLDFRLLRVCRHIFTETALLPYAFNEIAFESEKVRRKFMRSTRKTKKLALKKAIGDYKIMD